MHIVYALDSLTSGGSQREVVETSLYLRKNTDHRVSVLMYNDVDFFGEVLRPAGVDVVVIPKRGKLDPGLPGRIRAWIEANDVSVVHCLGYRPSLWYLLAVRGIPAERRPGFVAYEVNELVATAFVEGAIQRFVYRRSDAVTANSRRAEEGIRERLGVDRDRVYYVANGHDLEAWDEAARRPCPLPLEDGHFHFVLVGRIHRQKNHELVLEALAALGPERIRDWRVWFIGADVGLPGYPTAIQNGIEARGLSETVQIHPATTDIAAVMARAQCLLLPSLYEGLPNVLLEAMASRLPIVASRVGEIPNVITDGESGLLLPEATAGALAEAMVKVRELSEESRQRLGARAREIVEARYQIGNHSRGWLDVYDRVARR